MYAFEPLERSPTLVKHWSTKGWPNRRSLIRESERNALIEPQEKNDRM